MQALRQLPRLRQQQAAAVVSSHYLAWNNLALNHWVNDLLMGSACSEACERSGGRPCMQSPDTEATTVTVW